MIYAGFDFVSRSTQPWLKGAEHFATVALECHRNGGPVEWRAVSANLEWVSAMAITHERPDFGVTSVTNGNGEAQAVSCTEVLQTPFARLLRFKREGQHTAPDEPRILLVAPMSGHFATLLAGTLQTLVQDHEVYVTDWINARDISPAHGRFGFAEYVEHIIRFLRHLGPPVHLMAVCQPTVACLAAAALMAADDDACQPSSIILMAGPIDTRFSPTKVNELAKEKPIEWFEQKLISTVPYPAAGAGRRVYPGMMQLTAFMSMNLQRHIDSLKTMRDARLAGDDDRADSIRDFYKEYFAVMDLPAEFYLETVRNVFQEHELPRGRMNINGRPVDCSAIRRPFLLTIEGERDDICGIGQTLAAQDLCSRMPVYKKTHHLQAGVGHYGVFNGKRWERRIYPVVREFIRSAQ